MRTEMNVQTTGAQIRDLGRVLPWMASPPRDQSEDFAAILTPDALVSMAASKRTAVIEELVRSCEHRQAGLAAMLERMTAELKQLRGMDVESAIDALADPDGEATDSCESTEAYFRAEQRDLAALRKHLLSSGGLDTYDPKVFVAIDDLHTVFGLAIACMQQARWLILMAEGGRDAPSSNRTFASGAALIAAIEAGDAEVA